MTKPERKMNELNNRIDEIVFKCFDQGVYWGKLAYSDGGERPDKPDYEIDRTQAVKQLEALITEQVQLGLIEELSLLPGWNSCNCQCISCRVIENRLAQLKSNVVDSYKSVLKENK